MVTAFAAAGPPSLQDIGAGIGSPFPLSPPQPTDESNAAAKPMTKNPPAVTLAFPIDA